MYILKDEMKVKDSVGTQCPLLSASFQRVTALNKMHLNKISLNITRKNSSLNLIQKINKLLHANLWLQG